MKTAAWTYELPPTGAASEGVQDYEVRSADGRHVGIALDVVRTDGETFLLVDAGPMPPLIHRRIAVPWDEVAGVDHELLVVSLSASRDGLDERALAVDPKKAVHGPGAAAARVTGFEGAGVPDVEAGPVGPVVEPGRGLPFIVLTVGAIFSAFAVVTVWIARGVGPWELALLAIPLAFAAAAVALEGYRFYRGPHTA